MYVIVKDVQRETTANSSAHAFSELVASDGFRWRVQQLAHFTLHHQMEGAFAVYAASTGRGEPVMSALLEPSREELQEAVGSSFAPLIDTLTAVSPRTGSGLQINMMPLLVDEDEYLRRDITMEVHSHADEMRYFHPSLTDLDYHVEHSLLNPGLISGIVAVDGAARQASLLAYRFRDPATMQPGYLERLNNSLSSRKVFEAMQQADISYVRLDYQLRTGRLQSDPNAAATQLIYG